MPLIKTTTTTASTTAAAAAGAAVNARTAMPQANATTNTYATTNGATTKPTHTAAAVTTTSAATRSTCGKVMRTNTLTKSVPATPVQPKSPTAHFISTSPECEGGRVATTARVMCVNDNDDDDDRYNNCSDYLPHSYPNFTFDLSEDDSNDDYDDELELDDSSLAMITPPPPYVDTPLQQYARVHIPPPPPHATRTRRAATAPPPPTRKKLFQNREIFNMNTQPTITPSSSSFASAITPTKLSAAAAAMFAAPQMAQLNKKWTQLHRKRRRRNSSSGDSKELDKLVLQSVDWDENDIY